VAMATSELDYAPPKSSLHSSTTFAEMSQASISGETGSVTTSQSARITGSAVSSSEDQRKESLVLLGDYSCSAAAMLTTFSSQLLDYIVATQNTLDAHLTYYIFNIHAAASPDSPASPAPSPSTLPTPELLIGKIMTSNLSAYIYTPVNLAHNRANLNSSWFTVPERYRPIIDYYSISEDANGIWSTDDGWPSESFIEFSTSKRALLQFGTIDPQMQGVDYSSELEILFPSGYIEQDGTNLSFNSAGPITNNCYLHNTTTNVSSSNSSWATVSLSNPSDFIFSRDNLSSIDLNFNLTSQLTDCGISPLLNTTLNNVTADIDFVPYRSLAASTIWSWAPGEPKDYNTSASPSHSGSVMRCTATSYSGRWAVADCARKHYTACRAAPYNWTISAHAVSFSLASTACPTNYTFSAPASALENAYLTQAIRLTKDFSEDKSDGAGAVLLAFNSLNVPGCWVAGQGNTTCPYSSESLMSFARARTIVVPTVAVIIILVVSAATLFAKGVGHRRGVKKRMGRKARNGFVYEGVPS